MITFYLSVGAVCTLFLTIFILRDLCQTFGKVTYTDIFLTIIIGLIVWVFWLPLIISIIIGSVIMSLTETLIQEKFDKPVLKCRNHDKEGL